MKITTSLIISALLLCTTQTKAQLKYNPTNVNLTEYVKSYNISSSRPEFKKFLSGYVALSLEGGLEFIDARSFISNYHYLAEQYDRGTLGGSASFKFGYLNIFQYERKRRASSFEYSYPTGRTVPYNDPIIGITTMVKESEEVTVKLRMTENLFKINPLGFKDPFPSDGFAGGFFLVYGKSKFLGSSETMNVYGIDISGLMKDNKLTGMSFGLNLLYYDAKKVTTYPGLRNLAFNLSIGYGIGTMQF